MGSAAKPADHLLLGVIDAFMKTSRVFILLTFVFVGCLVLQGAQLTANQAKALAVQLADEKFATIWHVEKTSIFKTNTPSYGMGATLVTTNHFVDDHWVIDLYTSQPDHQFEAHIELAADGSTNQTTVRSHQGLP